jgi:hypothetical protein
MKGRHDSKPGAAPRLHPRRGWGRSSAPLRASSPEAREMCIVYGARRRPQDIWPVAMVLRPREECQRER